MTAITGFQRIISKLYRDHEPIPMNTTPEINDNLPATEHAAKFALALAQQRHNNVLQANTSPVEETQKCWQMHLLNLRFYFNRFLKWHINNALPANITVPVLIFP